VCLTIDVMPEPKLARAADSALVVVDIQERLAAVMPARAAVVRATGILLDAAALLGIPVLVSEQYPKGLGATVPEVAGKLPKGATRVGKTAFSACGALPLTRPQAVIAGMEAHVCVLQTALEMAAAGREVFVVADAVCSRSEANYANALTRMQAAGVVVTNLESVLFEWLRDAAHEQFRAVSKLIR
jgi:nicotinamidase-related amidase